MLYTYAILLGSNLFAVLKPLTLSVVDPILLLDNADCWYR